MQEDNVMAAMSKVSALMEHFQLYGASVERQLETTIKKLDTIAERMPQQLQHSAHDLLGALPPQIVGQVGQHLSPSVKQFEQRLDASVHTLQQGTQAAAEALQTIQRMHRWLIWKMLGITFGCLLLLTAGGVWLAGYYADVVRQNQVSAELMEAYNSADVAPCGDRLCARVDPKGKHYGEKGEYVQVMLR